MYMHFSPYSCSDNFFPKDLLSLLGKLSLTSKLLMHFCWICPEHYPLKCLESSQPFRECLVFLPLAGSKSSMGFLVFFFFIFVHLPSPLNSEYTFPRVKEFSYLWSGGGLSSDLHCSFLWSRTGMQPFIHFQDKVSTVYWHTLDKLVFISWFIWPLIKSCLYFIQAVLFCLNIVDKKGVRLVKVN